MPLRPSAALKTPAGESKVGHLKTRGYLENSPRYVSVLIFPLFAVGFEITEGLCCCRKVSVHFILFFLLLL